MKHASLKSVMWSAAAAAAIIASAPAFASDSGEDPDSKVICKRDSTVGTRLAKRICMTRGEWKEAEMALREKAKDSQREYQRDNEIRLSNKDDTGLVIQGPPRN